MPLFYQQDIHEVGRLGVWWIREEEGFFLDKVPLQREITHPHKRLQHLAGRFLLQELYPDFPYELIRIADTRKPYLDNEAYHFSISHCGDYAAAFVSPWVRVGVDVEGSSPRIGKVLHKFLHPGERAWLDSMQGGFSMEHPEAGPYGMANLLWSAKESVFKWYGEGGVDFSEHIRLDGFGVDDEVHARFQKDGSRLLMVRYRYFGDLCLSWVHGPYTE
jgi:phosphopantetheinyl transferase (holo-ACP synthase)